MASQPLETPDAVALQHARRSSGTAWGKGAPSPAKVAIHEAGRRGLPAPGGPKGMNAPIPSKPPKGR